MSRRATITVVLLATIGCALVCVQLGIVAGLAIASLLISLSSIVLLYRSTRRVDGTGSPVLRTRQDGQAAPSSPTVWDISQSRPAEERDHDTKDSESPPVAKSEEQDARAKHTGALHSEGGSRTGLVASMESDASAESDGEAKHTSQTESECNENYLGTEHTQHASHAASSPDDPSVTTDPEPTPEASQTESEPPREAFDYEEFRGSLRTSPDPLALLRKTGRRARARMTSGEDVPGALAFLSRQLEELGLLNKDAVKEMPGIGITRLRRTGLFYIRTASHRIAYGSMLRILGLEAALNALEAAHAYGNDLKSMSEQDIYRFWQRTKNSLCAQAQDIDTADWSYLAMPWQVPYGPTDQGEWAVRQALAEAIESVQLPYRLEAKFRCNVADGDVAIEFGATPYRAFPRTAYVSGMGIVPATQDMRRREASAYAARVGILLANQAFRAARKIRRVWVAAIGETPSKHTCLYSVCIGRQALSRVRMGAIVDPLSTLRSLGASFEEENEAFVATDPLFYLEDKVFCPPRRYDLWDMSERVLPAQAAHALGTSRVSGLIIHEDLPRSVVADSVLRDLVPASATSATQSSVHTIMEAAHRTSDMSVWSAAERVANKLVDGRLDISDANAIYEEFVSGDSLTKTVERAQEALWNQQPHEALRMLQAALDPLESAGTYQDTEAVAYRCFDSFAERVIYNRLNQQDRRTVVLAPEAYLMAHLLASALYLSLAVQDGTSMELALSHARRALQVAPLNGPANLSMAACLEAAEDLDGAYDQLSSYLASAHTPQGMGFAYLRLASIAAQLGKDKASSACLQRAIRIFPPLLPFAIGEYQALFGNTSEGSVAIELMGDDEMERVLAEAAIPAAPTTRIAYILYDSATASIDAEVFPVAHDLMRILEALTADDVIHGIRRSLELEPDA